MYGSLYQQFRSQLWNGLYDLGGKITKPWLILRDFNALLTIANKIKGKLIGNLYDVAFWEFFQFIGAIDIPFKGFPYIWSNRKEGP